jgi:hypothetical protein
MNDVWGVNTWAQCWSDCWGYPAPSGEPCAPPRVGSRVLQWFTRRIGGSRVC